MRTFQQPLLHVVFLLALSTAIAWHQKGAAKQLQDLPHALGTGLLPSVFAKELCSCHFVARMPFQTCLERSQIPQPARWTMRLHVDAENKTILVRGMEFSEAMALQNVPRAIAAFDKMNPQFGCRLISGAVDQPRIEAPRNVRVLTDDGPVPLPQSGSSDDDLIVTRATGTAPVGDFPQPDDEGR